MVQWSQGKNALSEEKDAFNYFLSAQRQSVERVFGVMHNRFGILWRPMSFSFDRYKLILVALCRFEPHVLYIFTTTFIIDRLHNFIQKDRELALLNKRHEICHEEDTLWRRGLSAEGDMPDDMEMIMVASARDSAGPGMGYRSDLMSDRRQKITRQMKLHRCKRPKGSKEAQEIRSRRVIANLTCG